MTFTLFLTLIKFGLKFHYLGNERDETKIEIHVKFVSYFDVITISCSELCSRL